MLSVLVKDTNEVLGFPDTTDKNTIEQVIRGDQYGEITQAKPNWYKDKIQPALEATGMDIFQPKFLLNDNIDRSAQRAFITNYAKDATFGILENKNPVVKNANAEASQAHPIAAFSGSLVGQVQSILETAGIGEILGFGKVALAAGETAAQTFPKIKIAGQAASAITHNAGVGALYGAIRSSVGEINNSIDNNTAPDLVKVGEAALKDSGAFALYGALGIIPSKAIATSAIAGTAYALSKAEGANEPDALLNAAVMGAFHLVSSHPDDVKLHEKALDVLDSVKADYIKAKAPQIHDAIVSRTAQEHKMFMEDQLKESIPEENISIEPKDIVDHTVKDIIGIEEVAPSAKAKIDGKISEGDSVSNLSKSVEVDAIKTGLVKDLGDLPSYEKRNMDEIAAKVSEFINNDYELAKKIALGEAPEQGGLRSQEIFTGLREKARAEGDINTLRELALSDKAAAIATELGQRVKALDSGDPSDPVRAIRDLKEIRASETEKRIGKGKVESVKKEHIKNIKESIKKVAKKQDWEGFVKSLEC